MRSSGAALSRSRRDSSPRHTLGPEQIVKAVFSRSCSNRGVSGFRSQKELSVRTPFFHESFYP